jgi:uncharacterized membrane protein
MILSVVAVYTLQAYLSNLNSIHKGKYTLYLYLSGLFPLWTIASIYTKNMFFDGLVYDVLVTATFAFAILYFTGQHLKLVNWFGMAMIIAGLILVRK